MRAIFALGVALLAAAEGSSQAPSIRELSPTRKNAYEAGILRIRGTDLDLATRVSLGGIPQTILQRSATELVVQADPCVPGNLLVRLESPLGVVQHPFSATPLLSATPATIGGALSVALDHGDAGVFAIYLGSAVLPIPVALPGIHYGLLLDPTVGLESVATGLTTPNVRVEYTWPIPNDPTLAGGAVHFQAWTQQGLGTGTASFSNLFTADIIYGWNPSPFLSYAVRGLAAASAQGRVLAIGGDTGVGGSLRADVEGFDPALKSWSNLAPLSAPRTFAAAGTLGGEVYVAGGLGPKGPLVNLESYDPVANRWTPRKSLRIPRWSAGAAVLGGRLHLVGGLASTTNSTPLADHEVYDPLSDSWTALAPLPTPRSGLGCVASNGRLFAIGGIGAGSALPTAVVEEYDPATDRWVARTSMPTPRAGFGCVELLGKIHAFGGIGTRGQALSQHEEFDPSADAWTIRELMPTPRYDLGAATYADRILALGGERSSSAGPLATAEEYSRRTSTPGSGGWTPFEQAGGARIVHVSATGDDAADGSLQRPRRTLAGGYALLRDGSADWLLLRRGDTFSLSGSFQWQKSGPRSGTYWMRLGAYGDERLPRPILLSQDGYLVVSPGFRSSQTLERLAVTDVYFLAAERILRSATTTTNVNALQLIATQWQGTGRPFAKILVENCRFSGFTFGFTCSDDVEDLTIRRCIFDRIFGAGTTHSSGVLGGAQGWLLEENLFYQIMSPDIPGVGSNAYSPFSHSVYITADATAVVVRRNFCIRVPDAPMQRAGGVHAQNVAAHVQIAGNIGQVWGTTPVPGGVEALVAENLTLNPLGAQFFLGNIRRGVVRSNLLLWDAQGQSPVNLVLVASNSAGNGMNIGVHDTSFESNFVSGNISWNPSNTTSYSGLSFSGNQTSLPRTNSTISEYLSSIGWHGTTIDDWASTLLRWDRANFTPAHSTTSVLNFYRALYGLPSLP